MPVKKHSILSKLRVSGEIKFRRQTDGDRMPTLLPIKVADGRIWR